MKNKTNDLPLSPYRALDFPEKRIQLRKWIEWVVTRESAFAMLRLTWMRFVGYMYYDCFQLERRLEDAVEKINLKGFLVSVCHAQPYRSE